MGRRAVNSFRDWLQRSKFATRYVVTGYGLVSAVVGAVRVFESYPGLRFFFWILGWQYQIDGDRFLLLVNSAACHVIMRRQCEPTLRYRILGVLRRAFILLLVVWTVVSLVTLLIELVPGDPAVAVLGEQATPEQFAQFREKHGLDRPPFFFSFPQATDGSDILSGTEPTIVTPITGGAAAGRHGSIVP